VASSLSVRRAGFHDSDPTGTAALDPTRRQMRAAVRRARPILRTEAELQEAGAVIANGYLRLDRAEWIRVVEKRPSPAMVRRTLGSRLSAHPARNAAGAILCRTALGRPG
jgi:hypothetical protein